MILIGDVFEKIKELDDNSIDCCVTSPPYWGLRDYGKEGQVGLEETPQEFVAKMVSVFAEVHRVLKPEGTLWLNLGDSYVGGGRAGNTGFQTYGDSEMHKYGVQYGKPTGKIQGFKSKDLVGIPWRVAIALQEYGWYLRQDIIWSKPNPMPESVTDRCTKAHEYIFLLSKEGKYFYDHEAIRETSKGTTSYEKRNKRSVWEVTVKSFGGAHFATYPEELIKPCILAGCPEGGTVLDPFFGSGTTGVVAKKLYRNYIGIELNPEYAKIAEDRINNVRVTKKAPWVK